MAQKVTLLDGGFSTQLQKYLDERADGDPLWTAKFLAKEPGKCALVHKDYVLAGANIISTATYQASIEGFKTYLGLDREDSLEVIRNSVQLAKQGIEMAQQQTGETYNVRIAGSVGPYGAHLHDGSEYTGSYAEKVTTEQLIAWHRPRVEALIEAGVDLLAFETLPCFKEAEALMKLLKEFPKVKAWVSFSIKDSSSVSNGERFYDNVLRCWEGSNQLIAVGANCFQPLWVVDLCRELTLNHSEIPLIIYPNRGETYEAETGKWLNTDECIGAEALVNEWINLGISYVGGCCRTDNTTIQIMAKEIKKIEERNAN